MNKIDLEYQDFLISLSIILLNNKIQWTKKQ